MSTILKCVNGPGERNNIQKLLQTAENHNFASSQKMPIIGMVCGEKEEMEEWQ